MYIKVSLYMMKYKKLMSEKDWKDFQRHLKSQSKWEIYYNRIEKVSETINQDIVIWEDLNILGFYYKQLHQGVDLAFYLKFKEFIIECIVFDEGKAIDYIKSNYRKNSNGDIKFIKNILERYG